MSVRQQTPVSKKLLEARAGSAGPENLIETLQAQLTLRKAPPEDQLD
jgi:hypothetical protein